METEIFRGSNSPTCLRFWFNFEIKSGTNPSTLNILKYNYEADTFDILWSLSKQKGTDRWREGTLSYIEKSKHSIIFEAVRADSLGDVALGNIDSHYFTNDRFFK